MAFLDKVLGKDEKERQLEKEIRSLELRRESVFSAINGEIARLQKEKTNVLLKAGNAAYETWRTNGTQADLTKFWDEIVKIEQLIDAQEKKKKEMGINYDEEIRLINSNLNSSYSDMSYSATAATCPKCGTAINSDDVFCQRCGAKLQ